MSNRLAAWRSRHSAQRPALTDAIFDGRFLPYFFHRTRFLGAYTVLRTGLHLLELAFVAHLFPAALFPVMVARMGNIVMTSAWWGLTDDMRHTIRALRQRRDWRGITREITGWVSAAWVLGGFVLLASVAAFFLLDLLPEARALLIAIGLQTMVQMAGRSFYSGAFALRRIYIPPHWMILIEMGVYLFGAMMLVRWMGAWSAALCVVVATALTAWLSYRQVRRTTDLLRVTPAAPFSWKALVRSFGGRDWRRMALAAGAAVGMRLGDVIALLVWRGLSARDPALGHYLVPLYMVLPLVRSAGNWAQLLHFDLVKQHLDVFDGFRSRMERATYGYALLVALFLGTVALAVLFWFAAPRWQAMMPWLALFLAATALLGAMTMALFSRRAYGAVLAACLIQLSAVGLFAFAGFPQDAAPLALAAYFLLPMAWAWRALRSPVPVSQAPSLDLLPWLARMEAHRHAVTLVRCAFARGLARGELRRHTEALAAPYAPQGCVTLGPAGTAWLALPGSHALQAREVAIASGGVVEALETWRFDHGQDAARFVVRMLAARESAGDAESASPLPLSPLPIGAFTLTPLAASAIARRFSAAERRAIISDALSALGSKPGRKSAWQVAVRYERSAITALYLMPRGPSSDARSAWRKTLRRANLESASAEAA